MTAKAWLNRGWKVQQEIDMLNRSKLALYERLTSTTANYTDKDNWKRVEPERYVDAALRHMMDVMTDMRSVDKESGLLHAEHALTNLGFLCAILRGET